MRAFAAFALLALGALLASCGESADGHGTPTPLTDGEPGDSVDAQGTATPAAQGELVEVRIGDRTIQAEVAETAEERTQGLSGRTSLAEDGGMLFVHQQDGQPTLWMKDMHFPLDFIWISVDRRVADLTENVPIPEPGIPDSELPRYQPDEPVRYVLEVNAGLVQEAGIQVGDAVTFQPDMLTLCGDVSQGTRATSGENIFANPSFEEGRDPWISLETEAWGKPFSVSDAQAQSGANSALLEMRSDEPGLLDARRYGVVQEVTPEEFPEVLSGCYYVERWEKGTPKQYLQVAVIAFDATNIPPEAGGAPNYQMRYVLTGVEEPPFTLTNGRFVLVGREEPEVGRWIQFERNVRRDFEELWGAVPEGFSNLRILFEVNWDERQPSDGPSVADVYYDDLYLGPAR